MATLRLTLKQLRDSVSVPTNVRHRIVVVRQVNRVRLVGMFFDLNKCFLLPSATHGITELPIQYDQHPGSNLLVVGHTDTSGQDAYNLTLSLERAKSVAAYLTDDVPSWEAFFKDDKPAEKRWGLLEVQHMLTVLPEGQPPFYDGTPNGRDDARSKSAVRAFQLDQSLTVDGIAGPVTRKALITAYMGLDGTSLPGGVKLTTHGCGENFPVDQTGDDVRSPENRRVEIFFFDGPIKPPPAGETSAKGSSDYPAWLKQVEETIDISLGTASTRASLTSRYALDRFQDFANALQEDEFVGWASRIYGSDIPLDAYRKFRNDLVNGAFPPPEIQLVPGGIDGDDGAYDNATQEIGVREELALAAETDPASAGELIVILMHEFGHHVDHQLRHQYSTVAGDAPDEEGTQFAYGITSMHHMTTDHVPFANLTRDGQTVELALDFPEFRAAVQTYLSDPNAQDTAKAATVEFFGAGRGNPKFPKSSFGHRSIEDGLGDADPAFFSAPMRDQIYFGNWLRDFSQFNDPAWLRYLQNRYVQAGKQAKELVTELLDLGAKKDFDPDTTPSAHVAGVFHVTTAKLGVYRPEEHIDNPQDITDGSAVDPLFHGPCKKGSPEIAVDPATGLKAYIATRSPLYRTASEFVEQSFRAAIAAGFTPEGRRLFGQGLHTLEDLFAHSNFCELAFIRFGHTSVFPWVGAASRITVIRNGKPQSRFPMVTGVFGMVDTGVSGASAIGEALEKPIECEAGKFSSAEVATLKLIEAVSSDLGQGIESLFTQVKELEKKYPKLATALCRATDAVREWIHSKLGAAMREEIKQLDVLEAAFFDDPSSTAPTHSQLAKDHDDHPLHVIAAQSARLMVADVGTAARDAWQGKLSANALVARALAYLVHPDDVNLAQVPGPGQVLGGLQAFADGNPAVIKTLDFATSKARFLVQRHAEREQQLSEARAMYANDEENADRIVALTPLV